jgi:hypothetical protein
MLTTIIEKGRMCDEHADQNHSGNQTSEGIAVLDRKW